LNPDLAAVGEHLSRPHVAELISSKNARWIISHVHQNLPVPRGILGEVAFGIP